MFQTFQTILGRIDQILVVFSIAFSLMNCFFGYRLLRLWVGIIGFLIGFVVGFGIGSFLITDNSYGPAAIGIAAGLAVAFLAFKVYLLGVFLFCAFAAGSAIMGLPFPEAKPWLVLKIALAIVGGLAAGILAAKFSRPVIVGVTAVTGGVRAVSGMKTPIPYLAAHPAAAVGLTVILAALGLLFQLLTTGQKKRRR